MGRNGSNTHDVAMRSVWLATVACCTALHDAGMQAEGLAAVMPDAMSALGNEIIGHHFPAMPGRVRGVLPGDAIRVGQDYAGRLLEMGKAVTA